MKVYGNKGFDNPTHVTYVAHQDKWYVGYWDAGKLAYVFTSDKSPAYFEAKYPNAKHVSLVNNSTIQVISKVDFKKAEIAKYFDITTMDSTQDNDYSYDEYRKHNLVVVYAKDVNSSQDLTQRHLVYGLLNNGSRVKNTIQLHIVGQRVYIIANVFGVFKQISTHTFETGEDLLYQVLYTFKQHGIPVTVPVMLSGGVDKSGKLAQLLTDYIPNVQWQAIPDSHLAESSTDSHLFYDMYLAKQCV